MRGQRSITLRTASQLAKFLVTLVLCASSFYTGTYYAKVYTSTCESASRGVVSERKYECFARNMCPSLANGISMIANHTAFRSFDGDNARYAAHSYLTKTSLMLEVGGFTGVDVLEMRKRFGGFRVLLFEPVFHREAQENLRNEQVEVYPYGLGKTSREIFFDISGDGTHPSSGGLKGQVKSFTSVLVELKIDRVDLLQINCEGCEWEVLEAAIETIHVFHHIQVQFHQNADWVENKLERYAKIQDRLTQTHELVFDHPWIWQLWRLK